MDNKTNNVFPQFDRHFFASIENFTLIGKGSIGGKASGLAFIKKIIHESVDKDSFPDVEISIPRMTVIASDVFDKFIKQNNLTEIAYSDQSDTRIANAFQKADLPVEILGDLRALIESVNTPLAIRSSSILEDAQYEPFAGIYATKMISNNQSSPDTRFHKLLEAIKFVYASTFFKAAKDYIKVTKHSVKDEKMGVIIQEVVGSLYNKRYYPNFSGVGRSYNYYPTGRARPEDGVVNLALGLGKTIVDGGLAWTYSHKYPKAVPPFADPTDILKQTQTKFWSVNMGDIPAYDPTKETEYLKEDNLDEAEKDESITYIASTYSAASDKIVMGIGGDGPRIINFSRLLTLNEFNFNKLIEHLLSTCSEAMKNSVEIEFAVTIDEKNKKLRFGFLQVRPMVVSFEQVNVNDDELESDSALVSSTKVLGNGIFNDIVDILYVKPELFEKQNTPAIANEIDEINKQLVNENRKYLLIGFGRWGSSDPWLGIPVEWGQIAGVKIIVESTLHEINVELSQGSHFFHNLTSFGVGYFSVRHDGKYGIDWDWLEKQNVINDKKFIKHVRVEKPLSIKIDGRESRGVILR